jgi:hypothetical protein
MVSLSLLMVVQWLVQSLRKKCSFSKNKKEEPAIKPKQKTSKISFYS